ncbi:VanZ family protein [Enterococcus sp. AZ109]|uniref:VanZ family protein n=1 Tax=Enterococcus sp. AZ109 TaxID=2774634 RepID=UPI003F26820D
MKKIIAGILSFIASFGIIYYLVLPTLMHYPRLAGMMYRFVYTDEALWAFLFLSMWLFYIQWEKRQLWSIYLYLFYSVYALLMFIVLFTKAEHYHALNLNIFNIPLMSPAAVIEFVLNICYFIPLGVLYGMRAKRWETVVLSLVTIFGIETLQYVFYLGTFDIWDVLTNFAGCMAGYQVCMKLKKQFVR